MRSAEIHVYDVGGRLDGEVHVVTQLDSLEVVLAVVHKGPGHSRGLRA